MNETTKKSSSQLISDFLNGNKKVLLAILAVIIVIIAVAGVMTEINKSNYNEMLNSTTQIDKLYEDAANGENVDKFLSYVDEISEKYDGSKAELIAFSRAAAYYFDEKDFEKAYEFYNKAYIEYPEDIAASVFMFNAAMAKEELGDLAAAIEILTLLVDTFKNPDIDKADMSPDVPEAIFNLGRLYESQNDFAKATEQYELLVAEYQSTNITNLAKTRLLTIK